jgi:chorismate mutase
MASDTELETLRQELRTVDHQILDLIARRNSIVHSIGQVKKNQGLAIKDDIQEQKSLTANLQHAGIRIPALMVEELTKLLAAWGRKLQQ